MSHRTLIKLYVPYFGIIIFWASLILPIHLYLQYQENSQFPPDIYILIISILIGYFVLYRHKIRKVTIYEDKIISETYNLIRTQRTKEAEVDKLAFSVVLVKENKDTGFGIWILGQQEKEILCGYHNRKKHALAKAEKINSIINDFWVVQQKVVVEE